MRFSRRIQVNALTDMVLRQEVGCCLPTLQFKKIEAKDYLVMDVCDYLCGIIGSEDDTFQWNREYGGCSLFQAAADFIAWPVMETFYSTDLVLPEGLFLSVIKRPLGLYRTEGSIIKRIMRMNNLTAGIRRLISKIQSSKNEGEIRESILQLSSDLDPKLDSILHNIPLSKREYLCIKTTGALIKLLRDYGVWIRYDHQPRYVRNIFNLHWI